MFEGAVRGVMIHAEPARADECHDRLFARPAGAA
jgi:hypothetical protein